MVPGNFDWQGRFNRQLAGDRRVGFFSFIGSGGGGLDVAVELAPGTRCSLEHGGMAPVVVAADAELDGMTPLLVKGGFYHAGQVCVSVQRIFAARPIADRLAAALAQQAGGLKVGDATLPDTQVGPLIRESEVAPVGQWVDEAIRGGAVRCGGGRWARPAMPPPCSTTRRPTPA